LDGLIVGRRVGRRVGVAVLGLGVGNLVGCRVGCIVGVKVGEYDGDTVGTSVGDSDIVGASDTVGLIVGDSDDGLNDKVGGSVGELVVGEAVGSLVGAFVTIGSALHELPFSEMRTVAYAGLALVVMLSTVTFIVLPSMVPLHDPPALSLANKEDSA
jgi:hypothetical protein